jgi:adenylosuccinate synthase
MKQAIFLAGLLYGDEGKGSITDALTAKYNASAVVRYNGGAQAAHNVVDDQGRHHTFTQFGSGTLNPGVKTFLSQFMLINPLTMQMEEMFLQRIGVVDGFERVVIDERAPIITPFHEALNRLREMARGAARHGSTGFGIGELNEDIIAGRPVLRARDLYHFGYAELLNTLNVIQQHAQSSAFGLMLDRADPAVAREYRVLDDSHLVIGILERYRVFRTSVSIVSPETFSALLREQPGTVIFEGAQGALLDTVHGFAPHNSWTDTTFNTPHKILYAADVKPEIVRLGIMRSYATRHGAGPLVTEAPLGLRDTYNGTNAWQGAFREGWLDLAAIQYGIDVVGGVDALAVTHCDVLPLRDSWRVCTDYTLDRERFVLQVRPRTPEQMYNEITEKLSRVQPLCIWRTPNDALKMITDVLRTPVAIESYGADRGAKMFLKDLFQ